MEGWAAANQVCEGEPWVDLKVLEPIDYAAARARIAAALQAGRGTDAEALRAALHVSQITGQDEEVGDMCGAQGKRETAAMMEAERLRAQLEISDITDPNNNIM